MSNETPQTNTTEPKQLSFGDRLKSTRESKGLERKDAAAQLRLTEKIIAMMEYERYPVDMPITFIKGYIRAYSKLLELPDHEVNKAIAPIKSRPQVQSSIKKLAPIPMTSENYFMQGFTYLIAITLITLVGVWWYNHPRLMSPVLGEVL